MKLGMSCYCLDGAMAKGMTVDEVIDFAAAHGCEHIEFVPFHLEFVRPDLSLNEELCDHVREKCASAGIEISTYSVNGNLLMEDEAEQAREIERIKRHIDAAERMGLKRMRLLTSPSFRRPFSTNTIYNFRKEFPEVNQTAASSATTPPGRASTSSWKTTASLSTAPTGCSPSSSRLTAPTSR